MSPAFLDPSLYHTMIDICATSWSSAGQSITPQSLHKNHGSALTCLGVIDTFLEKDCSLGANCGPFSANPLVPLLTTSPLQIANSRSGKPRVVLDFSYPHSRLVNSGIPKDTFLNKPFSLRLPGTDALQAIILVKVPGCHLFKKDLSCAYRRHTLILATTAILGSATMDSSISTLPLFSVSAQP